MDRNLPEIQNKKGFSIENYGLLLVSLCFMVFMFRIMWATGSTGNRISAAKIEKRGIAYLEQNYPGLYEKVHNDNSGTAYQQQDGTWSVHYYQREDNSNRFSPITDLSFNLVIDNELNVITDGYQEYYLKGGTVYSKHANNFYRTIYNLFGPPYSDRPLQLKGDYQQRLDDYDFERAGFYEAGDGFVYNGDYLDPEKEYDANELYGKYGCADLKFFMESGGYADFEEVVKSAVQFLKEKDIHYNTIHIYMWFRDSDIIFCEGTFTMEDRNTDIETALKEKTVIFTQAEYDRRKAAGEQQPNIQVGKFSDLFEQ